MIGIARRVPVQIAVFAVVVGSLPFWFITSRGVLAIAIVTLLFAAASTAFTITGGLGGQLSFGHSIFFGLGAYATALTRQDLGWNVWSAAPLAAGLAVIAALALALPSARLDGVYFVLVSFVATLSVESVVTWAAPLTGGAAGVPLPAEAANPALLVFATSLGDYHVALSLLLVLLTIVALVGRSTFGLRLRAVRDDPTASAACGVDVVTTRTVALALSAALTSLVGVAYVQYSSFVDPATAFGSVTAVMIAMPALFGGLRSLWGPVLGAAILIPVQQVLNPAFSGLPAGTGLIIFGLLVILIQTVEPRGIAPLLVRAAGGNRA